MFIPLKTDRGDYAPAQALTMKTRRSRPQGRRGRNVNLQHRVDEQLDDDEVPKLRHLRSFTHIRCTNVSRSPVQQRQWKKKISDRKSIGATASGWWKNLTSTYASPNKGPRHWERRGEGERRNSVVLMCVLLLQGCSSIYRWRG